MFTSLFPTPSRSPADLGISTSTVNYYANGYNNLGQLLSGTTGSIYMEVGWGGGNSPSLFDEI